MEESIPTENKIQWEVWNLMNNRSGGPSGMRAEHLWGWLEEAQKLESVEETKGETEEGTAPGRETDTET